MYDKENVFAKILRGEITCSKVYENECVLAFYTIQPQAKTHVLVIPKGEFVNIYDFVANADEKMQTGFWIGVKETVDSLGLSEFKTVTNTGKSVGQSVFHFHIHIMAN